MSQASEVLSQLSILLEQRKQADPSDSYVAKLYEQGLDKILQKVGEEATETIIAAKNPDNAALIYETADLWFHCMVMLAAKGLSSADVLTELDRRFGLSGLDEKASRQQ